MKKTLLLLPIITLTAACAPSDPYEGYGDCQEYIKQAYTIPLIEKRRADDEKRKANGLRTMWKISTPEEMREGSTIYSGLIRALEESCTVAVASGGKVSDIRIGKEQ